MLSAGPSSSKRCVDAPPPTKSPSGFARTSFALRSFCPTLEDNLHSVSLWTSVGERFGRNAEVVDALAALHERAERWEALASLLSASIRESESDNARRAHLCARLGDAAMDHLADNARALQCFRAALHAQPSHERARARLRDLSADSATAAGAVDALATAYTAMDEWEALLALLEARLAHADDASTRALLLLEAASTYEKRAEDNTSALACVCRAFVEVPAEKDIEQHMLRLAEACGEYTGPIARRIDRPRTSLLQTRCNCA